MGMVIYMSEALALRASPLQSIRPKSESRKLRGHTYVLSFCPNAMAHERWEWTVKFTCVHEFSGHATTMEKAGKAAVKQIEMMEKQLGM